MTMASAAASLGFGLSATRSWGWGPGATRQNGQALFWNLPVTFPVRRVACDSCVPFHGDSPIARHSGARGRRCRGGSTARLAVGADRLGAARDNLDAVRVDRARGSQENFSDWVGRSDGARGGGSLGGRDVCAVGARGRLPGGALRLAHQASARGFRGPPGGNRDLVSGAAGRRVWLRPGQRHSAFVAFRASCRVLRAGRMAPPTLGFPQTESGGR
jgi:hypothetical protein